MAKKADPKQSIGPATGGIRLAGHPLPAFLTIGDVEVAIVAKADYLALVALRIQARGAAIQAAVAKAREPPPGLSTIEKDAEVADFLRDRFRGRMTLGALHAACVEKFGKERAPLPGRIGVFRQRWRSFQ